MTVYLSTETPWFFNDIADILRLMLPDVTVQQAEGAPNELPLLVHTHAHQPPFWEERCVYRDLNGETMFDWTAREAIGGLREKRLMKRAVKQCCYYLMRRVTGKQPPWGSLTGIRPTRLYYEAVVEGQRETEIPASLMRMFDLRGDKARLLQEIVRQQVMLMDARPNAIDLYVGIPFCTTRCAYCSFSSGEIGNGKLVKPYLTALEKEISASAALVAENGLIPRALYIGGGTPTSLTAPQLDELLGQLAALFPNLDEWTAEAGRPDTMDEARLRVMRKYPVTRISVNPQTMNDATLRAIGRAHTAEDALRAFHLARSLGFDNINMDLIAALPGESLTDFAHTLDAVHALSPDCLTVHTLARKRATRLNDDADFTATPPDVADAMVEEAKACARAMGMAPYYLYRQKHMAGNLENVGYAKPGKACRYNVDIMEETTSILALGAGAISKRIFARELRIERAPNVANIEVYIARVDEMIDRKRALWAETRGVAGNDGVDVE